MFKNPLFSRSQHRNVNLKVRKTAPIGLRRSRLPWRFRLDSAASGPTIFTGGADVGLVDSADDRAMLGLPLLVLLVTDEVTVGLLVAPGDRNLPACRGPGN